jgi:acyl-coenzyme A thioesterase PaaI-like protein
MTRYSFDHPVAALNDHNCFGCGSLNAAGLHLNFYQLPHGEGVWAPWTPTSTYEGYNSMIHGGIICTVLDEVMAWSLYARDTWAVTAKMQTSFRKPVRIGEPVRLVGTLVHDRGRVLEIRGEIRLEIDDSLLAESDASFMRVPKSRAQEWNQRYLTGREVS